jgi:hypothetical protein
MCLKDVPTSSVNGELGTHETDVYHVKKDSISLTTPSDGDVS